MDWLLAVFPVLLPPLYMALGYAMGWRHAKNKLLATWPFELFDRSKNEPKV